MAGAVALLRSYNSSWLNIIIRNRLNSCAKSISGTQEEVGNGLLDVEAALTQWNPFVSNFTHSTIQSPINPSYQSPKLDWNSVNGAIKYEVQRRHWQWDWKIWAAPTTNTYTDIMIMSQSLQAYPWQGQPTAYWVAYRVRAVTIAGQDPGHKPNISHSIRRIPSQRVWRKEKSIWWIYKGLKSIECAIRVLNILRACITSVFCGPAQVSC